MNKNYQLIKEAGYDLKYDLSTHVFFDYYEPHVYLEKHNDSESSKSYPITVDNDVKKFRDLYFMKLLESHSINREELLNTFLNGLATNAERGSELDSVMLMMILEMPALHAFKQAQEILAAVSSITIQSSSTQRGRL